MDHPLLSSAHALLTPAQMKIGDRAAISYGRSRLDLIESAGLAVSQAVQDRWSLRPVLILIGPGDNGADGLVCARRLRESSWPVTIALLDESDGLNDHRTHLLNMWKGETTGFCLQSLAAKPLVIDAIFGSGLSRPIEGAARIMIDSLIESKLEICAIDVPSGLDGATGQMRGAAAPSQLTVTFFRKKPGHLLFPGRGICGDIVVADMGLSDEVLKAAAPDTFENHPSLWLHLYPWPDINAHKYKRGHVLVRGGGLITGASRLTARGAMRIGAGLVTLASPPESWIVYACALTSVMVVAFHSEPEFQTLVDDPRFHVVAMGPGMGVGEQTRQHVLAALATQKPVVLDADALTSFQDCPMLLFNAIKGPCVLTPHEGEFSRLFKVKGDKLSRARAAAAQSGSVVLLKGPDTVIAGPDGRAIINANAPAHLATAGSGDVLTGFIAGLLAQGLDPFLAAAASAWLHGETANSLGIGLIADDLPDALASVFQALKI